MFASRVGVFVSSNLPAEIIERDRVAENVFNAWCGAAENLSDLLDGRPRGVQHGAREHDHEVVVAFARDLVPAPRPGQDDGGALIYLDRLESLEAFAKATVGLGRRGRDVRERLAGRRFKSGDSPISAHAYSLADAAPDVTNAVVFICAAQRSGGHASRIHGTSRQRSKTSANSRSSSSVSGT